VINQHHVLARPGNGRQNATPSPRSAGVPFKYITALLLVARQASVQRAVRGWSVVRIVLNLGRRTGQNAALPGVFSVGHPNPRAGVGKSHVVPETRNAPILIEQAALQTGLGHGSEVRRREVDGQILRGRARPARAVMGDDGPVRQGRRFVGVADEEVLPRRVGTGGIVALRLLLLAIGILDSSNAKDTTVSATIQNIAGAQRRGKLIHNAADGSIAEVDGVVLGRVQLTILVVVRVAFQLEGVDRRLPPEGVDRGNAVLRLGHGGRTSVGFKFGAECAIGCHCGRAGADDAVAATARGEGVGLRRVRQEEPKEDGQHYGENDREGDGDEAAAVGPRSLFGHVTFVTFSHG
jgi:hypothetical protein